MLDYLINHAVKNVWCSPEQDKQYIIKPHRLSRRLGALDYQTVMWSRKPLPELDEYYHVFQIGHMHPKIMGLLPVNQKWMSLESIINTTTLMGEVYFNDGTLLPRGLCYLSFDSQKNLVLAIKEHNRFLTLRDEDIYLRLYSNAFFNSDRANAEEDGTVIEGLTVGATDQILKIQRQYHDYLQLPGEAIAYLNGKMVNDLNPGRVVNGDYIEYMYDSSIYRTVDFQVKDLLTFESILDNKRKYLLNYPQFDNNFIDFEDDIDFYLFKRDPLSGRYVGTHYHRNQYDAVRMLTHKDYSVPASAIQAYANDHDDWNDVNDLTLRLYIRKAGFARPLIQESHRLFELYRLPPEKVSRAMLGIDSTVEEWRAENLEKSAYVRLMRAKTANLDPQLVQEAYGYNGMAKLLGDTPSEVRMDDGWPYVDLPPSLTLQSTIYEYDDNGLLLGYYRHNEGLEFRCTNENTRFVEVIGGHVDIRLDSVYQQEVVSVDSNYNYRAYVCTLLGDTPAWDWTDVSNMDTIDARDGTIEFNIDPAVHYPAVISDKKFLGYQMNLEPVNGVLQFTVTSKQTHMGEEGDYKVSIPPRRIDVWLNGYSLVEDLDFHVEWPEVVVVNKEYLNTDTEVQQIDIRCTGFCNEDLTLDEQREHGFVINGHLSKDRQYSVRDDKVLSCIVGGKLVMRDELEFAEDNLGISIDRIPNGTPYSIRETIVPVRGSMYLDTYKLRDLSKIVDDKIEDYLTLHYPEPEIPEESMIPERYKVYSPFISRVINNLQEGHISEDLYMGEYSNADIDAGLEEHKDLLKFDPVFIGYNKDYVKVHPHRYDYELTLNIYQFNFVKRVIDYFFDGEVDLNHFIHVVMPTE